MECNYAHIVIWNECKCLEDVFAPAQLVCLLIHLFGYFIAFTNAGVYVRPHTQKKLRPRRGNSFF